MTEQTVVARAWGFFGHTECLSETARQEQHGETRCRMDYVVHNSGFDECVLLLGCLGVMLMGM